LLSLDRFSRTVRIAVYLLWTAGLAGLAVFALAAAFGDATASGFQALYVCLPFVFGALCILRAALIHGERAVWALFGMGMLFFGSGYAYYFRFQQHLDSPPYPSVADAQWITSWFLLLAAVMFLIRARLVGLRRALWIDVVVAALALAAVAAALLVDSLIASTGGSVEAVATGLSYPLLDLLMISVVLVVFALGKWRLSRTWALIWCGLMIQAAGDVIYLYQVAGETYEGGTLLDLTYVTAMSLYALAAWQKPVVTRSRQLEGVTALAIAAALALIGLILIAFDHVRGTNDVAFALAMLTLIAAFARAATTYADVSKRFLIQNESILNSAGEGIYGIDSDGIVTFANPAAMRMTGHEIGELDGRYLHEVIHHTRPDGTPCLVDECPMMASLEDGVVHRRADDVYWRKDGTSLPIEYTTTPIVEHGEVKGAVVVCKDVSERRELERTKDEFTSVVSHELRTPLTSIRGSLGLLESGVLGPLPEKGQRMIEIAVQNTDRLVRLINDILDIERMDHGEGVMHKEPTDAAELIARATEGLQSFAAEAQVTLRAETASVPLVADPDRVIQTLTNLISNAVKFSPPASTVRVSCARDDGEVLFCVTDEGRGIPADKHESIFERFQQVDASDSREKGGTGLGLAICRTIVENHGGRIWVESVAGEGSRFSFVLPALAEPDHEYGDRAVSGGPAVLICDDDASVVEVVGAMLELRGYRVIKAASGEQALERAIAERPDAILLDLLMPGISGWETAAALSQRHETSDIPIVFLSVLSEGEGETPGEPVLDWLEKPIDERALFAALERAVSRRDPFKVLVVEDDRDLAGILTAIFESHGIETFVASSGVQAIELAQRVLPDLVVLDIGLPEADGFEVVDWLRRHERLNALPMVVYTANDLDEADRERLRLGDTTEFLTKSRISPQHFERRVMALIARLSHDRIREREDEPEAHPVGR